MQSTGVWRPTNRQNNKKTHQNCMLASKTREKYAKKQVSDMAKYFFSKSFLMKIHRPYLQDCSEKKMCLKIFLFGEFSSAAPILAHIFNPEIIDYQCKGDRAGKISP